MARPSRRPPQMIAAWWTELRENISSEIIGLLLFLLGGFFLLSLLPASGAFAQQLPWLTGMLGWTAPLIALSLMIAGAVLMLGERAGYWSVEAFVGAELFLLSLPVLTFLLQNGTPNWGPQIDGASGGLVGVTLGSLTLAAFGRAVALLLVGLAGAVGLYLLVRFTPLLLLAHRSIGWRRRGAGAPPVSTEAPLPAAEHPGNFVTAHAPVTPVAEAAPASKKRGAAKRVETVDTPATAETTVAQTAAKRETPARSARSQRTKVDATQLESRPTTGQLPSIELLGAERSAETHVDVQGLQQLIEETLADFNVPVRMVHVESGPTVTQFGVEPLFLERAGQRRKVRVSRIVALADDLALALAVPAVRIEAPVPGRPYVGIEVPNPEKKMVSLRGILESKAMQQGGALALPLGRNTAGAPVVMDLAKAPHMLIAGATGAGKSVCLNTIITGLLMQHGPERLRFVMVDPKMVELPGYNGIPHLLGDVITDVDAVMGALTWLLLQMDDRYRLFQQAGVRNLESYNAQVLKRKKGEESRQPLPYIVLIIDE
ncbi:MAG TPA: DNA translocase FtsK, partial [Caldilineaceae bacterium]|nr:DNA translocase FtsK [Caldilineaceae bacterium]